MCGMQAMKLSVISDVRVRLLHMLVRVAGRPAGHYVMHQEGNALRVTAGATSRSYPLTAWTSSFLRHLYRGEFDAGLAARP